MFALSVPEKGFTMIFLLVLLEEQTLLDIPHFKKFVLILSPFLENSEINHETFEIQRQNGVLSFMETFVLSICKLEFSVPFGNVCLTSSWNRHSLTFNSHFTRRTNIAGYSPFWEVCFDLFPVLGKIWDQSRNLWNSRTKWGSQLYGNICSQHL